MTEKDLSKPIEEVTVKPDPTIQQFQTFLSQNHPLIGAPYHGPIDGISNFDLSTAAQLVEKIIGSQIPGSKVSGVLWNGKSFNTSTADLSKALELLITKIPKTAEKRRAILEIIKNSQINEK